MVQNAQTNPVRWFEIYVNDLTRAKNFYEQVFQLSLSPLGEATPEFSMLAFPSNQTEYGTCGTLVHMQGFEAGKNSTIVYFASNDCAVEANRAITAGGKIFKEKTSIGEYGFIALILDTEGNMIGIHSMT